MLRDQRQHESNRHEVNQVSYLVLSVLDVADKLKGDSALSDIEQILGRTGRRTIRVRRRSVL